MNKNIWFIRHAQSTGNAGLKTTCPASVPLTDLGKHQAQLLGKALDVEPDLLVTSSYIRTEQTAYDFMSRFPEVEKVVWPLHEFTYLSPEIYKDTTYHDRLPMSRAYWGKCDEEYIDGPGAESFTQFVARIEECFTNIDNTPHNKIVIFTHGLVIRLILTLHLIGQYRDSIHFMQKYKDMRRFPVANTTVLQMQWDTKQISGLDISHLTKDLITF